MRAEHQNETNVASATDNQNFHKGETSRKPWNSRSSPITQTMGKHEKSFTRPTFSSQTSQPSSPKRCQRSFDTYKYPTMSGPPPNDSYARRKQVKDNNNAQPTAHSKQQQSLSSSSSPRRRTLLRQSALENSKESLTGDDKQLTTKSFQPSSSPLPRSASTLRSIKCCSNMSGEQVKMKSSTRECRKWQNSVFLGQPTGRQNILPKTFKNELRNDDNNNHRCNSQQATTMKNSTINLDLSTKSLFRESETRHTSLSKTNLPHKGTNNISNQIDTIEPSASRRSNDTSPAIVRSNVISKHSRIMKSICRGVSSSSEIETHRSSNNVSQQEQQHFVPSTRLISRNLIANTQQDNKATTTIHIPSSSTSASLTQCDSSKLTQRGININSIDTNQDQSTPIDHQNKNLHANSSSNTVYEKEHVDHLPYISIDRGGQSSNLIKIPRHGQQGQLRDKIQLDQRNLQKSLIKKLTHEPNSTSSSSSSGDSKNKTMSNPSRNFFSSRSSQNNNSTGMSEQKYTAATSLRKTPSSSLNGTTTGTGTASKTSSSSNSRVNPIGSGIVRRILNKIENKSSASTSSDATNPGKKMNGFLVKKQSKTGDETMKPKPIPEVLQFLQPLPPSLEVMEGSEIILTVKAKGATKIVWVKNNKIIPNSPPDFEYTSNSVDGTYSLKIRDCFIEDTGIYICEAYGIDSDLACWCNVKVIEEIEDDASLELTDILEDQTRSQRNHKFIVPLIITSNASSPEPSEKMEEPPYSPPTASAIDKRLEFKQAKETSTETSREIFEDARENFDEEEIFEEVKELVSEDSKESSPSSFVSSKTEPAELPILNGEHDESHPEVITDTHDSHQEESHETIQTEIELHSKPAVSSIHKTLETTDISSQVPVNEMSHKEEVEVQEQSHLSALKEDTQTIPFNLNLAVESEIPSESVETLEIVPKPLEETFQQEILQSTEEVRVPSSVSIEEELSSAEVQSTSCTTRSYSSQSSRESFGETRVGGDGSASGSDTIFLPSPFEEPHHNQNHMQPSVITEDTKSIAGSSSLGSSSLRDSFSSPIDPRILMGPGNLIVMLGETVNLRVKIQTSDVSGTTVTWCKLVCGKYRRLGTTKPGSPSDNSTVQPQTINDNQSIVSRELTDTRTKGDRDSNSNPHIEICKTNGESSDLITLRITNANYEDSGKYRVKAQNQLGVDYHQCILSVEGPPVPPAASPNASYEEKSHSILVSWSCCPYDGGSAVTGYVLEVLIHPPEGNTERSEASNWVTLTPSSFQRLCYTLKNPRSGFSYRFRVSVENAYGKGETSSESESLVVPEFSGVPSVTSSSSSDYDKTNIKSLEEMMRKISLSKDLSDDEISYEYKDVTLKHESFHEYYDKFEQLGKGRFGVVFKVLSKATQSPYAGKFVKCIKAKDKERAQLEFQIMNELKYHPKLICLVDAFQMPREIVIVTEMINGGELFERVVADDFTLTEHDCIIFLRQICDGVNYIHEKNIMHLDLKPENILCTTKTSNKIKIIDFGLAQHYNPEEPIRVLFGTAEFVSPEIINYDTICPATDMWSVGVITYILLSGLSPFLGDNDNETFSNITRGDFDFEDEAFDKISEDAKEFISSLILKRKEDRLTAKECLSHKWLALSDEEKRDIVLPTDKLKRFLLRRKWQKTGHAIRAIGRITTLYSSRRSSGSSSTSSSSPMSLSLHRSLSAQESFEDSVFGSVDIPENSQISSVAVQHPAKISSEPISGDTSPNNTTKPKYDDSSRSDSGICDVVAPDHNKT